MKNLELKVEKGTFYDDQKVQHGYTTCYLLLDNFIKIKLDHDSNYKNLIRLLNNGEELLVKETRLSLK